LLLFLLSFSILLLLLLQVLEKSILLIIAEGQPLLPSSLLADGLNLPAKSP
jgi:hypothetical protein